MKRFFYVTIAGCLLFTLLTSCERAAESLPPSETGADAMELSVEMARQIYEADRANRTRSTMEDLSLFALGDPTLYWDEAEFSASDQIRSVDVPISGQRQYAVIRLNEIGEEYVVYAHSKIIIVQSIETLQTQCFIRVSIPDAGFDSPDGENIANRTLNCGDRGRYTGLEYYATLDGFPAAVSRYEEGEMVCGLYLYDQTLTREEKTDIFIRLLGNTWIKSVGETRNFLHDNYGDVKHGDVFIETSTGKVYVFVDANADGSVDSVMDLYTYLEMYGTSGSGNPHTGNNNPGGNIGGGSGGSNGSNSQGNGSTGNEGAGGGNSSGNNNSGQDSDDHSDDNSAPPSENEGENNDDTGNTIINPLPGSLPGQFQPTNPGNPIGGGPTPITPNPEEEEDEETRLGREGIEKMISDLESGNVQMYECTITDNLEALLYAVGVGSNTTGIITSCINFLESATSFEKTLGNRLAGAGVIISTLQTIVAFSDGEYSTADWMNAVSTALSAISVTCILLPTPFTIVGGVAGVTSCLIGLASNFVSYNIPMLIHLEMPDGGDAYLYLA